MITPLEKKVMDGQMDSFEISVRRPGQDSLLHFMLASFVRQTIQLRTSSDDYEHEFVRDGLKVNRVPSDSAYYDHLYTGDVITHVDFAPYQSGLITQLRKQLMAGHRVSVMISVRRPRQGISLVFELVKG